MCVREFLKGGGNTDAFVKMVNGDNEKFSGQGGPKYSVNFVTAHDGFTLADLVSYRHKCNDQACRSVRPMVVTTTTDPGTHLEIMPYVDKEHEIFGQSWPFRVAFRWCLGVTSSVAHRMATQCLQH